jgi:hypothetical protein
VEVLHIASLEGVRVPVIATRTDTDDTTLTVLGRILPGYDSTVTTHTEDGSLGAILPCSMVGIVTLIGTNVILCSRVGDVVTSISAVNSIRIVTGNNSSVEWMIVLSSINLEIPRAATKFRFVFILTPTVVRCSPFVVASGSDERWKVGCITGEEE